MLKEERVYVLKDEKLRVEIIRLHHDLLIARHGGQWKMVELVTRNYWWPEVTKEIKQYVEGCDQCQRIKNRAEMLVGKLRPNEVPERPWQHISVDFITKLPMSTAEELARLFRDNVWKLHRLPESVISDKGPQFAAGLTNELNKMLGIETKLSMAYHPQTDS